METINAVGYCRVSSEEQAMSGLGLASQMQQIAAYCAARGMNLIRIYEDAGASGGKMDRPALSALRRDVVAAKDTATPIHCFVIQKFDRLSRVAFDMLTLTKEFQANGVNLVSVMEGLDATTPMGKAMLTIIAAFAELERDEGRARTKRALRVRRDRGQRSHKAPFGFRAILGGGLMPYPPEIELLDTIFRLTYVEHYSIGAVSKYLAAKGIRMENKMVHNRLWRSAACLHFISEEVREAAFKAGRIAPTLPVDSLRNFDPNVIIAKSKERMRGIQRLD